MFCRTLLEMQGVKEVIGVIFLVFMMVRRNQLTRRIILRRCRRRVSVFLFAVVGEGGAENWRKLEMVVANFWIEKCIQEIK